MTMRLGRPLQYASDTAYQTYGWMAGHQLMLAARESARGLAEGTVAIRRWVCGRDLVCTSKAWAYAIMSCEQPLGRLGRHHDVVGAPTGYGEGSMRAS